MKEGDESVKLVAGTWYTTNFLFQTFWTLYWLKRFPLQSASLQRTLQWTKVNQSAYKVAFIVDANDRCFRCSLPSLLLSLSDNSRTVGGRHSGCMPFSLCPLLLSPLFQVQIRIQIRYPEFAQELVWNYLKLFEIHLKVASDYEW